jgi:hypothetical protein
MIDIDPELLRQLSQIVTVTESGQHFRLAFPLWPDMEAKGWIKVHRPEPDPATWYVTFTREGLTFADEHISDDELALA